MGIDNDRDDDRDNERPVGRLPYSVSQNRGFFSGIVYYGMTPPAKESLDPYLIRQGKRSIL